MASIPTSIPSHFECIREFPTSLPSTIVSEYFSHLSGVRVFHISADSPLVRGSFCVPTEVHHDEGLPHTLEHLIFLGSKDFPVKGVLDSLASRCLADGTNAWTAVDHTAYTLSTAGSEGFLNMLPIYLDHILRPTLAEDAFFTEVHHFQKDGSSAGVVYSELQNMENSSSVVEEMELLKYLYPGDSGYKYNTGGKMDDLRKTNNTRVRDYHHQYYRWNNLNLIISGIVDMKALLSVVAKAEFHQLQIFSPQDTPLLDSDAYALHLKSSKRPWRDEKNFTPLQEIAISTVSFPSDDVEFGNVIIGWRGVPWNSFIEAEALDILGNYLTDSNVSPLQKHLVEIDDPYCSVVDYRPEYFKATHFLIECLDVPYNPLDISKSKIESVWNVMQSVLTSVLEEGIDMKRMKNILSRESLAYLLQLEVDPHSSLSQFVIEYCINGESSSDLNNKLQYGKVYEELLEKDEIYWLKLLKDYFIDAPHVEIRCVPSQKRFVELQKHEEDTKKEIVSSYGEIFLSELSEKIVAIKEKQAQPISETLLQSIPLPNMAAIPMIFHPVYRNYGDSAVSFKTQFGVPNLPFPLQINEIPSNFVYLRLVIRFPETLSSDDLRALPLLTELLFESDVILEGNFTSYDTFTALLLEHTVSHSATLGFYNKTIFPDAITFGLTLPLKKYFEVMKLLKGILFSLQFSVERLSVIINTLLNGLTKQKRNGKTVMDQLDRFCRFEDSCSLNRYGLANQEDYLKNSQTSLETTLSQLTHLYKRIFCVENIIFHLSTTIDRLPEAWIAALTTMTDRKISEESSLEKYSEKSIQLKTISEGSRQMNASLPFGNGLICGLSSADASYLRMRISGPKGYDHLDLPPLMILCNLFTMLEGPFYRLIRGGGMAYGFDLSHQPATGDILLSIYPATEVVQALLACQESLKGYLTGKTEIQQHELITATSVTLFSIISREKTNTHFALETFVNGFKGLDTFNNKHLLEKVSAVTLDEIKAVMHKYFTGIIDFSVSPTCLNDTSLLVLVSNKNKVNTIIKSLESHETLALNSVPFQKLYRWMAGDAEETLHTTDNEEEGSAAENGNAEEDGCDDDEDDSAEEDSSEEGDGDYSMLGSESEAL
ncbi:peptidase M16 inactive domain-containing protein [Cardiosporidium cionae]|uniref:Peptidase M16 inactive domain-containing protein n=1 Tax=Cardiosporidium cionae TaxID=476202 RepID=A0ABQ7JB82_9APIC|nr:peptidase M16 inactive domain-containing protein [Cardiosporidium cionae]|eukprot:KAF8821174.1 peptidase M16 inactive domain-containing protein [Cardiosporidium cionae]